MISGWAALPPLCPGSITTTLPASGRAADGPAGADGPTGVDGSAGAVGEARAGRAGPEGAPGPSTPADGAGATPAAGVSVAEHAVTPAARSATNTTEGRPDEVRKHRWGDRGNLAPAAGLQEGRHDHTGARAGYRPVRKRPGAHGQSAPPGPTRVR